MSKDAFTAAGVPHPNNNPVNGNTESPAQQACREYIESGYSPLFWKVSIQDAVNGMGKGPKEKGWQRLEYTMPPDGGHYQIGLKMGAQVKAGKNVRHEREGLYLCCIDIDDPKLQDLAVAALPATKLMGGKKSTPKAHFFYVTERPCNTFKWATPKNPNTGDPGKCAVEIFGVTRAGEIGHQIVVAPSNHFRRDSEDVAATSQPYVWDANGEPGLTTPEELFQACSRIASGCPGAVLETGKGLKPAWTESADSLAAKTIIQNNVLATADRESRVWKMSRGEMERVILTAYSRVAGLEEGNRQAGLNKETFCAASVLAGAGAPEAMFESLNERLLAAADELAKPFDNLRIWATTISRAIAEGKQKPRQRIALRTFPLTDQGTAELLTSEWRDDYRYVTEWKQWLSWNGVRWQPILKADIERGMAAVFRWAVGEAGESKEEEWRKDAFSYYFKCESGDKASRISHLLTASLASGLGLSVPVSDLNRDPWLFCCGNGTFDIRTGKLRESRREDLITMASPYSYVPGKSSPMFTTLLDYEFGLKPDAEALKKYFLSWLGCCMSGDNSVQKLVVIHGNGCNGKSAAFGAVYEVCGDYGALLAKDVLIKVKCDSKNSDEVADLCGKRFGFFSESNPNDFLDEGRVKSLTGGETVQAQRKYQSSFRFPMTCKLNMDTNYKPRIRGTDDGILRRVRLVPFDRRITEEMRDLRWQAKLLETEGSGLLTMLLDEGHEYYVRGDLAPEPVTVTEDCEAFAKENDIVGCFISDKCVTAATDYKDPARQAMDIYDGGARLYGAYQLWCKENGCFPVACSVFMKRLLEKGYKQIRKAAGTVWYGLELRPNETL